MYGLLNGIFTKNPTAEALSKGHRTAAEIGNRADPAYGGNCTPDEHDKLKEEQNIACDAAKGLTCGKGEIDYGKVDKLEACAEARIKILRKCFAGGDKGHNRQINQVKNTMGNCMGRTPK